MIYLPNPDFPVRFAPFPAGDDFFAKGESAGPGGPLRARFGKWSRGAQMMGIYLECQGFDMHCHMAKWEGNETNWGFDRHFNCIRHIFI